MNNEKKYEKYINAYKILGIEPSELENYEDNEGRDNEGRDNEGRSNEGRSNEGRSNERRSNEGRSNERRDLKGIRSGPVGSLTLTLKNRYRRLALIYHPDKNKAPDAADKFREVQEAYEFLMKYEGFADDDEFEDIAEDQSEPQYTWTNDPSTGYNNILFSFLNPIFGSDIFQDITSRLLRTILDKISQKCEEKAFQLLRQLDKRIFSKIIQILHKYSDILHLSGEFLDKLDNIFEEQYQGDECIILSPFLDDLFDDKLYRLTHNGSTYFIPLWHTELVYDNSGADLYVQCTPILQDNVIIDENNNIIVQLEYTVEDIWNKKEVDVILGKKRYHIMRSQLKLTSEQLIVLQGKGISKINTDEIYDVSKKSDIYVHIKITP